MMIRYSAEQQQTVPNHQSSRLRGAVIVAAGVALTVVLLVAITPALFTVQHNAFALLKPYLNHLPAEVPSYHPAMLACGGLSLPC